VSKGLILRANIGWDLERIAATGSPKSLQYYLGSGLEY